jgi:hypothetical protein
MLDFVYNLARPSKDFASYRSEYGQIESTDVPVCKTGNDNSRTEQPRNLLFSLSSFPGQFYFSIAAYTLPLDQAIVSFL